MDINLMQTISDYGLAIVGCVGAGIAAWKLLHFLLKDVIATLRKQDSIIIDLIDKTTRLEIIIQRMDSKLDTLIQKRSRPLLKGDRTQPEEDE
jgi:hypothetical protein|tara:strand:- start:823 stop:1101 length:279 start_codon:yes stop_codon:yes gene_type:complete